MTYLPSAVNDALNVHESNDFFSEPIRRPYRPN